MSDILNNAKQNYADRLNAPKRVIKVPEWGTEDKPLEIYVKQPTLYIRDRIYKVVSKDSGLESLIDILILRSLDCNDIPLFTNADKADFMNKVDPDVTIRVATEINADMIAHPTDELAEIEKN